MEPGLWPGDIVIARRNVAVRPNDVVIARMSGRDVLKRVSEVFPNGSVFLVGDNLSASTDSRTLGAVKDSDILGVAVIKLKFAKQTPAPIPLRKNLVWVPYFVTAITVLMLLAQLLTFDKYVPIISTYYVPGGLVATKIVAAMLVLGELLALPFWLRMNLSPLFRLTSMASGVFFVFLWILLLAWALANSLTLDNTGHFGAVLQNPLSWWVLIAHLFLIGLTVFSAYILNAPKVLRYRR